MRCDDESRALAALVGRKDRTLTEQKLHALGNPQDARLELMSAENVESMKIAYMSESFLWSTISDCK